ncbi:MAG: CorA family divalent cation transporter [Oscillospiraceae bacterium]
MIIYKLGDHTEQLENVQFEDEKCQTVIFASALEAAQALKLSGIEYDGELSLDSVAFSKIETQNDFLLGTLCIPKFLNTARVKYKIMMFISRKSVVIIDNFDMSHNIFRRIRATSSNQRLTIQRVVCSYLSQLIQYNTEILIQHEKEIMRLEERISEGITEGFTESLNPIRKELLVLRSYYDELSDMGKELEQDENELFEKKQRKYFGTIFDRADRLMNRAVYLLEYAQQVRDAYQSQIDAKQNSNMAFLTAISTIFFPLTLITGWYGMNFENMPELKSGYPFIILLSIAVVIICIIIFKRKKML